MRTCRCSMCGKSIDVSGVTRIYEYQRNERLGLVSVPTERFVCPNCRMDHFEMFDFDGENLVQTRFGEASISQRFDNALDSLRNTIRRKAF